MNEATEKAKLMKRASALAKASRHYIERLWKMETDVLKIGASIASLFSSVFDTLIKAVTRAASLSTNIRELSLTRFMLQPTFDLWSRRAPPPEEEHFPTDMGRANVSFLFNVTVARKTATELAKRVAAKTPKPALLPKPTPLPKFTPLPEAELVEETLEERIEEPPKTVPYIVADLQSRLESKLTPSIKGITSALREYGRQTIPSAPLLAMPKPLLLGPAKVERPPSHPLAASSEKEARQISPHERPFRAPVVRLTPEAVRPFRYATGLPSTVLEQESPILEREIPFLKRIAALSSVSSPKPPLPSIEPPYHFPEPAALPPMPSQISRLTEEVFPSLASWIYGVSEVLRGTTFSLSAVPIAASTAERSVTEALIQPVSNSEASGTLGAEETVSTGLTPSKSKMGVEHVEAFRLPGIVASLVVGLRQRYPLLFTEPIISETWGAPFELMGVAPEETIRPSRMPEVKRVSKLPTVIALAAAESLIAQRLQHEFGALTREMQVVRSSYGEKLGELPASGSIGTTMLGKLAAAAPALSPTLESYASRVPSSTPPPARPEPVNPTIHNTFNITISAESAEEDVGDLERKISRILSEQMRRYYGSTRI